MRKKPDRRLRGVHHNARDAALAYDRWTGLLDAIDRMVEAADAVRELSDHDVFPVTLGMQVLIDFRDSARFNETCEEIERRVAEIEGALKVHAKRFDEENRG